LFKSFEGKDVFINNVGLRVIGDSLLVWHLALDKGWGG
jgi:hypothetical protein